MMSGRLVVGATNMGGVPMLLVTAIAAVVAVVVMHSRMGAVPLRLFTGPMPIVLAVVVGTALMLVAQMAAALVSMVRAVVRPHDVVTRMACVMRVRGMTRADIDPAVMGRPLGHGRERRRCIGSELPVRRCRRRHGRPGLLHRRNVLVRWRLLRRESGRECAPADGGDKGKY